MSARRPTLVALAPPGLSIRQTSRAAPGVEAAPRLRGTPGPRCVVPAAAERLLHGVEEAPNGLLPLREVFGIQKASEYSECTLFRDHYYQIEHLTDIVSFLLFFRSRFQT